MELVMEVKVRCSKEQYYIGTQIVRSMNQDKLEVVKIGTQIVRSMNQDKLEVVK